jgi:hypothetical protein
METGAGKPPLDEASMAWSCFETVAAETESKVKLVDEMKDIKLIDRGC